MNVLLINGSPHSKGSTYTALSAVAAALEAEGIGSTLKQVGHLAVRGCMACGKCRETGQCAIDTDPVNEYSQMLKAADGVVIGSPVYYAAPNGALCAFLDRLFMSSGPTAFAFKPAASVVSCRRGGASAAFDRLNKYFTISSMPIVSSVYWNSVHGNAAEETVQDLEGIHVMRVLGQNMAWLLKCIDAAKSTVPYPVHEPKVYTNFIR
ncbi:flavodoxin family protein [Desulfosarcina sp. OttesenSCG-928-G10]|nr:flavodoxin family protein [Desulfosarcina sp. OttesenSCG-928-G10]MDL2321430.1 flavodoxin family protein [Desulfosarcina sp. OttesenSCG-928-B08]